MAGALNEYPNGFSAPHVGYGNGDPSQSLSSELLGDRYQARPGSIRPSVDPQTRSLGRFHEPNPVAQHNQHPSSRTSMPAGPNYGYSNSLSRQNGVHGALVTPFSHLSTRSNQPYSQHSSNVEHYSQHNNPYSQHRVPYQQHSVPPRLITRPTSTHYQHDSIQEYHRPLGQSPNFPATTIPMRNHLCHQPIYPNVCIQIKVSGSDASDDRYNIGQVKQLFTNWKSHPHASLIIEGDTIKLIYPNPSSKGESPFALLEWAFKHTYDKRTTLTNIAEKIGFSGITPMDINSHKDIQQNQSASVRLLTTSDEYQIHLITRTLSNILPDNKYYHRVHQPVFYLSYTSWSYPPQSCLTQNDRIFLGAAHTTIEYPDELDAINGQMQVLSDFCHLTICLLSNWNKPPRIHTHGLPTVKDQIYECAYQAYTLSRTPDPKKTLKWSSETTDVFQKCPYELRRIERYKKLTNTTAFNRLIQFCNDSKVGESSSFKFNVGDHLCNLVQCDNRFTTENYSECTALDICNNYKVQIPLLFIQQKANQISKMNRGSYSQTLNVFITIFGGDHSSPINISPASLFVFVKLNNQQDIITEFVPNIVASSLYSLSKNNGLLQLKATHLDWLLQHQPYVNKIHSSGINISLLQRWIIGVTNIKIHERHTAVQSWLLIAAKEKEKNKEKELLLRADIDLFRTEACMTPFRDFKTTPCVDDLCKHGLTKLPVGIIASDYYRIDQPGRVGISAGDCGHCKTSLFNFNYREPHNSFTKQTHIAHCAVHNMDVCDECIPLTLCDPGQPDLNLTLSSGRRLKDILESQKYQISRLNYADVSAELLYQWLTISKVYTKENFNLDVMWCFFAERNPEMVHRALFDLTRAFNPEVSRNLPRIRINDSEACCNQMRITPISLIAPEYFRILRQAEISKSKTLSTSAAGSCDSCSRKFDLNAIIFDIDYQNQNHAYIKHNFIAHCSEHEKDICLDCLENSVQVNPAPAITVTGSDLRLQNQAHTREPALPNIPPRRIQTNPALPIRTREPSTNSIKQHGSQLQPITSSQIAKPSDVKPPVEKSMVSFECQICCESYTDDRARHGLTCGHTYCLPCIEKIKKRANQCPSCSQPITGYIKLFLS